MFAATLSAWVPFKSRMWTQAPWQANISATARPMPLAAPVTTATWPSSLNIPFSLPDVLRGRLLAFRESNQLLKLRFCVKERIKDISSDEIALSYFAIWQKWAFDTN